MRRSLKVHSAHRASHGGIAVVDLHNLSAANERMQFVVAEQPFEVTAVIADGLALQDLQAGKRCRSPVETGTHADAAAS